MLPYSDMTNLDTSTEHCLQKAYNQSQFIRDTVTTEGLQELLENITSLQHTGYIAISGFLSEFGVASMAENPMPSQNDKAFQLKVFFEALCTYGMPKDARIKGRNLWSPLGFDDEKRPRAEGRNYRSHIDKGDSNTFLLNIDAPMVPVYTYDIKTNHGFSKVPISSGGLVVLAGFHAVNEAGVWCTPDHAVNTHGDPLDRRKRIMYIN